MTKHSPGPWKANKKPDDEGMWPIRRHFWDEKGRRCTQFVGCAFVLRGEPDERNKANVLVQAAAPDLLKAARIVEDYLKLVGPEAASRLKIISAAIRKAEGETDE